MLRNTPAISDVTDRAETPVSPGNDGTTRSRLIKSGLPYPGLRPFREDESHIFFGRDDQKIEMLRRLKGSRFLAVVGVSGCGKSSLVRAGLIPSLHAGLMGAPEGSCWRVAIMRPGDRPIKRLATALVTQAKLVEDMPQDIAIGLLGARLRRGPLGLSEVLQATPLPDGYNVLIIADQFEEIFRYRGLRDKEQMREADLFVALLLAAAEQQRKFPIFVVLTMRSDFIGECAIFEGLPEAVSRSQFLAPRLTREQRELAIVGPARVYGGKVERHLLTRLLNDTGADPNQLPLLQHALMRMWTLKPADGVDLKLEDYEQARVDGLKHALSRHADEAFDGLDARQKRIARIMFRRLCEVANSTRRPTKAREIANLASIDLEMAVSIDELCGVADAFRSGGTSFITPDISDPIDVETVLDISHESLIKQWEKLRHWAEDEARSADEYRLLQQLALKWTRGEHGFLTDEALQNARKWRKSQKPSQLWAKPYDRKGAHEKKVIDNIFCDDAPSETLYELTMRFLNESVRVGAQRFREERKIRKRIEAKRIAREMETKKQLRRFRRLSAALVMLLVLAVGAGFWAFKAQQTATELEAQAVAKLVDRSLEEGNVRSGLETVVESLPPIDFWTALAEVWKEPLDSKSWAVVGRVGAPLDSALLAQLERLVVRNAARIIPDTHYSRYRNDPGIPDRNDPEFASNAPLSAMSTSPNTPMLVTASESGVVKRWNLDSREKPSPLTTNKVGGRPSIVHSMAFSRDGKYLAAISNTGVVSVWRVGSSPAPAYEIELELDTEIKEGYRYSIAIAAAPETEDEYRIVASSYRTDPTAWTWNSVSGDVSEEPVTCKKTGETAHDTAPGATSIDISADGQYLASGYFDGFARIWKLDGASCTQLGALSDGFRKGPPVMSVQFSPTGSRRLLSTSKNVVYLWEPSIDAGFEKPNFFRLEGHGDWVLGATFDPIGQRIGSISKDGTVRLWDANDGTPLDVLYGPSKIVGRNASVAFSHDGRRIAANFSDAQTFVWDLTPSIVRPRLLHEKAAIRTAALDRQGRRLITVGRHGAHVWSIDTASLQAKPVRTLPARFGNSVSVAFHPDGHEFLLTNGSSVLIWYANGWPADPNLETPLHTLSTGDELISWASYDATGARVLAASGATVKMFNARTQKKIQPELLHKARVVTAAFDVDGRWLVTLTEDRSLHLWDLETGENPSNTDLPDRWGEIEIEDASLKIVDHRDALRDKNLSQRPQSYVLAPHNGKLEIWTWGGEINHADADTTLWPIRTRSALKVLGDGGLQVRNLATDGILMQIPAPLKPDYWKAVVTSPGNEYLATISDQGMVRLTWLPPEDPSRIIRIAREQLALTPSRIAQ